MTTIVFDGQTLASDSRGICDYIDDKTKKLYTINNHHIGVAGNLSAALLFVRWYKDQTKPKPELRNNNDDFYAMVIKNNKAYMYDNNCIEMSMSTPAAIGSGSSYAMGALLAGKNAKEAIEITKKLDENTGGKVQTIKI